MKLEKILIITVATISITSSAGQCKGSSMTGVIVGQQAIRAMDRTDEENEDSAEEMKNKGNSGSFLSGRLKDMKGLFSKKKQADTASRPVIAPKPRTLNEVMPEVEEKNFLESDADYVKHIEAMASEKLSRIFPGDIKYVGDWSFGICPDGGTGIEETARWEYEGWCYSTKINACHYRPLNISNTIIAPADDNNLAKTPETEAEFRQAIDMLTFVRIPVEERLDSPEDGALFKKYLNADTHADAVLFLADGTQNYACRGAIVLKNLRDIGLKYLPKF